MSEGVEIGDDFGPAPHDPERDREIITRHLAQLREHFDAVEICAVRHLSDDDGTAGMHFGTGNWYARIAIVEETLGAMRGQFATGRRPKDEGNDDGQRQG